MKLFKNNRAECGFDVEDDAVIEKFCLSSFIKDKRRELKVRMVLFIASDEGYQSTVASKREFNRLIKRYNLINYKFKIQN